MANGTGTYTGTRHPDLTGAKQITYNDKPPTPATPTIVFLLEGAHDTENPEILPDAAATKAIAQTAITADKGSTPEGHVTDFTDLEDSEGASTGSDINITLSGSKELRDDDPEGETSSKKPKGTPHPHYHTRESKEPKNPPLRPNNNRNFRT
jgi:hypothetical protein